MQCNLQPLHESVFENRNPQDAMGESDEGGEDRIPDNGVKR